MRLLLPLIHSSRTPCQILHTQKSGNSRFPHGADILEGGGGERRGWREKEWERKEIEREGGRGDKGGKRGKEGWRDRGIKGGVEGLGEVERQATII